MPFPLSRFRLAGAVVLAVVGAAAAAWLWREIPDPPAVDNPARLAVGGDLYALHCAACHGAALEGEPNWQARGADGRLPAPPHDDSGHTWHHPDWQLFAMTKYGLAPFAPPGYDSAMPAFDGVLDDDEIRVVLAYIKSHWSDEARRFQARVTATQPPPDRWR